MFRGILIVFLTIAQWISIGRILAPLQSKDRRRSSDRAAAVALTTVGLLGDGRRQESGALRLPVRYEHLHSACAKHSRCRAMRHSTEFGRLRDIDTLNV